MHASSIVFNHPSLAKSEHFYKTPLHQDWTSMLASDDSVVVWLPLMDLEIEHGPVVFYPGSHKLGPLTDRIENGFAEVDFDRSSYPRVQKAMKLGDIAIFSTLLVHESGKLPTMKFVGHAISVIRTCRILRLLKTDSRIHTFISLHKN